MGPTVEFHTPRVIKTPADHEAALAEVERLMSLNPSVGTPDFDRLELLGMLVSAYEDVHYPIDTHVTPQDAIDFRLDQRGMTRTDLAPLMGGRSRVSEFFAGRRMLSKTQIRRLREELGVPADLLLSGAAAPASRGGGATKTARASERAKVAGARTSTTRKSAAKKRVSTTTQTEESR